MTKVITQNYTRRTNYESFSNWLYRSARKDVVPRLVESGHEVRALVRRQEQAETYQRMGIETTLGDILEPESLMMAAKGCDAALHLATAFAKNGLE